MSADRPGTRVPGHGRVLPRMAAGTHSVGADVVVGDRAGGDVVTRGRAAESAPRGGGEEKGVGGRHKRRCGAARAACAARCTDGTAAGRTARGPARAGRLAEWGAG